MKILIVTHAAFEKPGSIETWSTKNGHQIDEVRPYLGETIPYADAYDLIVIMGGPQSPLSIEETPYLYNEIDLLKNAIQLNKKIVGVCLGAQLISESLGAQTERSPNREIGCYPLTLLEEAKHDPVFYQYDRSLDVVHWHNDMPGLPEGAVLLAKSEGCPRQIYRYGDRIYGLQCHFELTKLLVEEMIVACINDLMPQKYVMTEERLMQINYDNINLTMNAILDYLALLK